MTDRDFLSADARRIVSAVCGVDVSRVTKIELGVMTFKYVAEMSDGRKFIVRFYPAERASVVEYEPDLVRRCRAHGMRVPEVLTSSATGPEARLTYMVYRMIPGVALGKRLPSIHQTTLTEIIRQLMLELRMLSQLGVAGFGDLQDSSTARNSTWLQFVIGTFHHGLEMAKRHALLDSSTINAIYLLGEHIDKFDSGVTQSLCWGDISPENIIVDSNDKMVGLVDFEGVVSADAVLALGYARARYEGRCFYRALLAQWPDANDKSISARSAFYSVVRALRLLPHGHEPLPTGVPRDRIDKVLPGLRAGLVEAMDWVASA